MDIFQEENIDCNFLVRAYLRHSTDGALIIITIIVQHKLLQLWRDGNCNIAELSPTDTADLSVAWSWQ